ncbi:MAG TPA: HlyD family efflux transporter periplasmic adaptor subunit [Candidatus Sulfotelmatobacter sp.]|jgi:multidrug efflux pump subunit AcrA (membrane-fusion protein)
MRSRRTILWAVIAVVLCATVGVVAAVRRSSPAATTAEIPTTRVKRGDLEMKVHVTGELRATHSEMMTAPPIGGGALQLTHLLHTGVAVKKGDLVMEFDPSEQHYKLEQSRSELLQAEQEITKARADAAVVAAQDKVALLKARFDVRRAELDVQKNELVSAIDARKNELTLEGNKRVFAELEQDVKSRSVSNQASIALAEEKRNKAKLAMDQAQDSINKMRVTAPMDGLIALQKNENATGGFFFDGMTLPEYHEGDQVEPGVGVGQVIDPSSMELSAKVGELERNNIKEGEKVDLTLDAMPEKTFHGTVKTVSANNARRFFDDDNSSKFEVTITLASADPGMRPGLTAHILINGDPKKNVLWAPRQAVFLKENKRVVFIRHGSNFDPHEVKVDVENESRSAVEGIAVGTEIALVDPTAPRKSTNSGSAAPSLGGGAP